MRKNIWIFNHYATNTFKDNAGRHYWFAENLIKEGYKPTIFCASTIHNSSENIDTFNQKYKMDIVNNIPFVFIKTPNYSGNGKQRVKNMLEFSKNLFYISKEYSNIYGKPDIILASSVHPMTLIVGIKVAKRFKVPCICEIRDLWPESLIAYGKLSRKSIVTKLLYKGEKWIYQKADKLIFTMEGGKDYIIEKGWSNQKRGRIDINKVFDINNGVNLEKFNFNKQTYKINDKDLNDRNTFKVIYTGSIRLTNNIHILVEAAKTIWDMKEYNVRLIIYGNGEHLKELMKRVEDENIKNIVFKGNVDKKYIPYILSKSDLNILDIYESDIFRFGISPNKLFDYLASGKPILSGLNCKYDIISEYNCGTTIKNTSSYEIAKEIIRYCHMTNNERAEMGKNSLLTAEKYNFSNLTKKLIRIIEMR